jgi:hypothetical protein
MISEHKGVRYDNFSRHQTCLITIPPTCSADDACRRCSLQGSTTCDGWRSCYIHAVEESGQVGYYSYTARTSSIIGGNWRSLCRLPPFGPL